MTAWLRRRTPAFAAHVGALTASQYVAAALGLLTTFIAARILGAATFGNAALVIAVPSLALSIAGVKAMTVTTRYAAGYRKTGNEATLRAVVKFGYAVDVGVALLVFAVVVGLVAFGVRPGGDDVPAWVGPAYAASLPIYAVSGNSLAVLTAIDRFVPVAVLQVAEAALALVISVGALLVTPSVTAYVVGLATAHAVAGTVWLLVASRALVASGGGRWWTEPLARVRPLLREVTSFLGWNYVAVTVSGLLTQAPILLLGSRASASDAGFYRLATSVTVAAGYVDTALVRVAYPEISALDAEQNVREITRRVRRWATREGPLGAVIAGLAAAALPVAVRVVFGADYGGMVAGTQLLLAATAVGTAVFYAQPYLYGTGRVATWVGGFVVYGAVTLAAMVAVADDHGFLGVAAVGAAGFATFRVLMAALAFRRLRAST